MLEDFDSVFSVLAVLLPAAKPILPGRAQTPDGQGVLWPEPSSADGHTGPGLRVALVWSPRVCTFPPRPRRPSPAIATRPFARPVRHPFARL